MNLLPLLYLFIGSSFAVPTGHPPLPPAVSNFQSILRRENAPSNTGTSSTLAAVSTGHPPLPLAVSNFQSILTRENAPSNTRTVWNIIWSCFATLFACTWTAVHPNIPAPEDSQWKILGRRLMIMACVLLAPEMVIVWAARQHRDAGLLVKEFQAKGRPSWTKTHAFFLIMGGFTLHAQGEPLRVLDWDDLEELARAGRIDWPDITEEQIKDKSKGDYLSKSIAILQSTWFIVQFFARAASKLSITQLEVATLAFCPLTAVIYFLWWNKPLDVRCSVPVHLVEQITGQATPEWNNVTDDYSSPGSFRFLPISPTILEEEEAVDVADQIEADNLSPSSSANFPSSQPTFQNPGSNFVPTMIIHPPPEPPIQVDHPRGPTGVNWKHFYLLALNFCRKFGSVMYLVLKFLVGFQFLDMMYESTLKTDSQNPNHDDHPGYVNPLRNGSLRVPTFYSYTGKIPWDRLIFAFCVSILFGAIHSVAWYSEFPTAMERSFWIIYSIFILVIPLILFSIHVVAFRMKIEETSSILMGCFSMNYTISRIFLLLLSLISLRALPPGAYVDFDWASVIPHI